MAEIGRNPYAGFCHRCPVCGLAHEGPYAHVPLQGIGVPLFDPRAMLLCSGCASAVANLYSIRHSGAPLTWAADAPDARYTKQPILQSLRWEVFRRDGFSCTACGSQSDLTADHVHPESRGGEATIDNLKTLCRTCNSRKGAKVDA